MLAETAALKAHWQSCTRCQEWEHPCPAARRLARALADAVKVDPIPLSKHDTAAGAQRRRRSRERGGAA